jgi:hypothetical protein
MIDPKIHPVLMNFPKDLSEEERELRALKENLIVS